MLHLSPRTHRHAHTYPFPTHLTHREENKAKAEKDQAIQGLPSEKKGWVGGIGVAVCNLL